MSVESLAIVLHHSRAKGTAKLVLLGIANHDGDGGAWPSVSTLARYANVDDRNVQRAIARLVELGEIVVRVQAGGTLEYADHERPNRYEVKVACPPWCDRTKNHRDTRKGAGRQTALPIVPRPVDKPGGEIATPSGSEGDRVAESPPGGVAESPPKPSTEPATNDVSASTTEAGTWPHDTERPPPLPPGVPPPTDELDRVRSKLRDASDQHHRREHRQ